MFRPALALSSLCVVLVAQAPAPAEPAVATGKYFELVCHGGDAELAKMALPIVEPVWPLVCAAFGVADVAPQKRLRVHLYRTLAGYQEADRRLTGGRFQPNQAMSNWASKSAHVAMQPACTDGFLQQFGLPMQTRAMLAWEATHIARFELCANFRSHPGWFYDGLAATTSQRVIRELHPGLGEQPFFSERWRKVRRLLDDEQLPAVRDLLADATGELDMRDRYAVRVVFFEFLRSTGENRAKLAEVARSIRSSGGGSGYQQRVQSVAVKALGSLDRDFVASVTRRKPSWDEGIRSLWCFGDEWRQVAFADRNAVAFRSRPIEGGGFRATGKVRILPGPAQQMNFLFARTQAGFYSLALIAGSGFVLFDHRVEGNQWRRVGSGKQPELRVDTGTAFSIQGKGRELEVQLAGRSWQFELPRPLPAAIVWGVGAQTGRKGVPTGTAGVWRGIEVSAR